MTNALAWTAQQAVRVPPRRPVRDDRNPNTHCGRMRAAMLAAGTPLSAADLAACAGLPDTGLVRALLKHDIERGAVVVTVEGHKASYAIGEAAVPLRIAAAIRLLRDNGYEVREP